MPMLTELKNALLAGLAVWAGLAGGALLVSAPALAQLVAQPQSVSVTVPQHEAVTGTVTVTNTGSEAVSFCLSFERPLESAADGLRLAKGTLGGAEPCGAYGAVLALINRDGVGASWDPHGLTTTPDGRLFTAESAGGRTYELTPELAFVRVFEHPEVAEFEPFPATLGVAYDPGGPAEDGTLWWLNVEAQGFNFYRALLLEGDLDGVATGRQVEVPVAETAPDPYTTGRPVGLAFDPVAHHFFYTDIANETVWAVDTLGAALPGYPVQPAAYPGSSLFFGLEALPAGLIGTAPEGAEGEGLRLELYINPPGTAPPKHLGVIGRRGEDTAPGGAEPLETPLPEPLPGTGGGHFSGEPVRSVLDPNGVLYYPYAGFDVSGVAAVRPPLPPSWLVVEAWRGTLAPDASTTIDLTFRAGARPLGNYTAVLQAFEAESAAAVEVPLSLTVTEGTSAEGGPEASDGPGLSAWPNPFARRATVALSLVEASEVSVMVYDVLGREVAVLHEGSLEPGKHRLTLSGRALPAGVYVVRAALGTQRLTERITLVR